MKFVLPSALMNLCLNVWTQNKKGSSKAQIQSSINVSINRREQNSWVMHPSAPLILLSFHVKGHGLILRWMSSLCPPWHDITDTISSFLLHSNLQEPSMANATWTQVFPGIGTRDLCVSSAIYLSVKVWGQKDPIVCLHTRLAAIVCVTGVAQVVGLPPITLLSHHHHRCFAIFKKTK